MKYSACRELVSFIPEQFFRGECKGKKYCLTYYHESAGQKKCKPFDLHFRKTDNLTMKNF
jgi:hypothetical protein